MENADKFAISLVVVVVLIALSFFFGKDDLKTCYSIEIEFTDGTKRTVQFESIDRPKITDEGCMYDHSKKSWICGCRDIQYKECSK